ncbi:MAG TPA: hypothetical protein VMU18_10230 [Rhodoblastus sp.]|nr:hypothetical protein [Rhodoblastus sp.]
MLEALRAQHALDPYLMETLVPIAAELGSRMGLGGVTVNAVPPAGGVMVCVLRPAAERGRLPSGVPAADESSPVTDPENRIIAIDSNFLRILVARIALDSPRNMGGAGAGPYVAVAETLLTPPPAHPELWGPSSPVLRQPTLTSMVRGAVAFVIAHELGHIVLGRPPPPSQRDDLTGRARQLAPMCPSLTDPAVVARRRYEEQADALAFEAVVAGGPALGRSAAGVAGDLGIPLLFLLVLAADIVEIATVTQNRLSRAMLKMQIGDDAMRRLLEANEARQAPGTELVGRFYSATHPAAAQRLLTLRNKLAETPGSIWYRQPDQGSYRMMLALAETACAEATGRH